MMRKLFLLTTVLLFGAALLFQSPSPEVLAQTTPSLNETASPALQPTAWTCPDVTIKGGKDPSESRGGTVDPESVIPQELSVTDLPTTDSNGDPIQYFVACGIDTEKGYLATTGVESLDKKIFGQSSISYLAKKYGYSMRLKDKKNPFTDDDGTFTVTAIPMNMGRGEIGAPRDHTCMVGYFWDDAVTVVSEGRSNPSLQYGTFTFTDGEAQCISVYSDPFGRVYNANLKPVVGAEVSLFDYSSKQLVNLFGVPNPVTTFDDGLFTFNIPPGTTYLETNLANITEVHPNYSVAYTEPYVVGSPIVETLGKIEQRDIAVEGGQVAAFKSMGYSILRTGDYITIKGSASYPLTLVDVVQGDASIIQQQSNKYGYYSFELDPSKIDPKNDITVKLTEVDLTTNPQSAAPNAQTDSIVMDPIPAYLEGYAYDENGAIMPFATVRVKLSSSDAIYYEAKADGNAFFSVDPVYLPIFPFYLEFVPANSLPNTGTATVSPAQGGTDVNGDGIPDSTQTSSKPIPNAKVSTKTTPTVITVPVFARQNEAYHEAEKIDIMEGTKNGAPVNPDAVTVSKGSLFGNDKGTAMSGKDIAEENGVDSQNPRYITLLVLVVLLIFVGTGAVLLIRKRGRFDLSNSGNVYKKEDDMSDTMNDDNEADTINSAE